jgi:hypothetical protein
MKTTILFVTLLAFFTSCEDRKTPEGALKSFVESRFDGVVTRSFVLERVTGKMREKLEKIPDTEFSKHMGPHIQKDSFKIESKECQDSQCSITYSVSYKTSQDDKTAFVTDVKKKAQLQEVKGLWLIADVSNLKTVHEATESINPLE